MISNPEYKERIHQGIFRIYTSAKNIYFADKLETTPIDGLTFLLTSTDGYTTLLSPFTVRSILINGHKIRIGFSHQK